MLLSRTIHARRCLVFNFRVPVARKVDYCTGILLQVKSQPTGPDVYQCDRNFPRVEPILDLVALLLWSIPRDQSEVLLSQPRVAILVFLHELTLQQWEGAVKLAENGDSLPRVRL